MISLRTFGIYLVCITVPFALDNAPEILSLDQKEANSGLLKPVYLYQWIVTAGPRKPRAHFVRVVLLDSSTDPSDVTSDTSPCAQRDFMARLITVLAASRPAVIA